MSPNGLTVVIEAETTWGSWSSCGKIPGNIDQNCRGTQSRNGQTIEENPVSVSESRGCFITNNVVDGGYTTWGEWGDCSYKCYGTTRRYRSCHDPTPCNGGKDCSILGRNRLTKDCGPIAGQWGEWGSWGNCQMPPGSSGYGTGTHVRYRACNNPSPICKGDYCIGDDEVTENCRVVPPCFNYPMFSEKFLLLESPMVIYTSAKVDIYLLTKNKCAPETIIYTYYELYKIHNETTEIQIGETQWDIKFMFSPGKLDLGVYRLYAKIGYPTRNMEFWMEESMFIKIEHPPPHAFIKGGDGRTVGEGNLEFDAHSESYSLTNGPGDPTGLLFQWKCINFVTKNLLNLLQFNIDPVVAFNDTKVYKRKWYETNFIPYIENKVAFIDGSTLNVVVQNQRAANASCLLGRNIYIKTELYKYIDTVSNETLNGSVEILTTVAPWYDLHQLNRFYDIDYMYEMEFNPIQELSTAYVIPVQAQSILVKN
ncbi:unnamed protein product [Mytilus edulis]|uniref:PKD/REJ-like domain-containing protein n=1 Tax=Mytilus edulis TaxID=6550 RepID=A0A8S3TMU9_MYTED|nr:unnamed protein product [Mytilus edulis]